MRQNNLPIGVSKRRRSALIFEASRAIPETHEMTSSCGELHEDIKSSPCTETERAELLFYDFPNERRVPVRRARQLLRTHADKQI